MRFATCSWGKKMYQNNKLNSKDFSSWKLFYLAILISTLCFCILILLPESLSKLLLIFLVICSLVIIIYSLYEGKWVISLLLLFYVSPTIYIILDPSELQRIYPLEYYYHTTELYREQLQRIFMLGIGSLLPGLLVLKKRENWGSLVAVEIKNLLSTRKQLLVAFLVLVSLFIAFPPTAGTIFTTDYVSISSSGGLGIFVFISVLLLVFLLIHSKNLKIGIPIAIFYIIYGLLHGRRVEQIGVLVFLFYLLISRQKTKPKNFNGNQKIVFKKSKKWYFWITVGILLSPIINLAMNFWGYLRIGIPFEFDIRNISITTSPGIIYASAAALRVLEVGYTPPGGMITNYILRFIGLGPVDFSLWVQSLFPTLGGIHVVMEPYAYFGNVGILLSSIIILMLIEFVNRVDNLLNIGIFTPTFAIFIPRLVWYGYIYELRLFQASLLILASFFIYYSFRQKLIKL
jgi:hypothetical protein